MAIVLVENAAEEELDALWETDEDAAGDIAVLLETFENSPAVADNLLRQGHRSYSSPDYHVLHFEELWRAGLNMYRLKFWDAQGALHSWRIIYAHNPRNDCIHILGIIPRDIEYDTDHPTVQRIRATYERLGLPTFSAY